MADYSRYKTETLKRMKIAAKEKYEAETMRSGEGWGGRNEKSQAVRL